MDNKTLLEDIKTYIKISTNQNYKDRLLEAYDVIKENKIKTFEEFENSKIGIGAFTYTEITLFDRMKDENYRAMLAGYVLELKSLQGLANNYGDRLASWGTIGKTPYREEYIKNGYIIEENKLFK